MSFGFLRAATMVALITFSFFANSKKNADNLETYKDQIGKSQVLLLQRERGQAIQLLIAAINREGPKSPGYHDLVKALQSSTEMFFSEFTQQAYEVALANYPTNRSQTIDKLNVTLPSEPQNTLLLKALLFSLLSQKECSQAKKVFVELAKANPFDEDLTKFEVLNLICQKNSTEGLALLAKMDPAQISQSFWVLNKQRVLGETAKVSLGELKISNTDSPEVFFLTWQNTSDPIKRRLSAEKYKNLCQTPSPFDKAYGWMDPWACEHLRDIDQFLSKVERGN